MKRVFLPADGRPAVHRFGYSAHVPLTSGSVRSVHVGCLFMSSPVYAQQLMKLSPPPPHPPPPNVISLPLPPPHDKPTKLGENRALYWDACQDSPWIYGRQTVFITRQRVKKKGGGMGEEDTQRSCPLICIQSGSN